MTTIAAAALVQYQFLQIDGSIWRSQFDLIQQLNAVPDMRREQVKSAFYDRAAATFPSWFKHYTFEDYLAFLVRSGLVTVDAADGVVKIMSKGREYLQWRVQQGRLPKLMG